MIPARVGVWQASNPDRSVVMAEKSITIRQTSSLQGDQAVRGLTLGNQVRVEHAPGGNEIYRVKRKQGAADQLPSSAIRKYLYDEKRILTGGQQIK